MSWEGILQLIARAKAGHDDAWGSLHEMVRPYLLNQAQSLLGPGWQHKSVSDLTQDTWVHVMGGIQGFRSGEDDNTDSRSLPRLAAQDHEAYLFELDTR